MTYLTPFLVHHGASFVISYINQKGYSKIGRELHTWKITQMPHLITAQSTYIFLYKGSLYLVSICFVFVGILLYNFLQIVLWDCIFFPQLDWIPLKAKGHSCDFFGSSSYFRAHYSGHIPGVEDVLEDCLHTTVKGSCELFCILFICQKVGPKTNLY